MLSRYRNARLIILLLILALLPALIPSSAAAAAPAPDPPVVSADSVFIMESRSGRELYARMADEPIRADSLLPMLIAMVVLDEKKADDFVLISEKAQGMNTRIKGTEGDAGLTAGERVTVGQLLGAVLLANSQDACQALAGAFRSETEFLTRIQDKAASLELGNTAIRSYFAENEDSGHTTVRDMAKAMQAFLRYPQLTELSRQAAWTFVPTNMVPKPRVIENRNHQILPGDDLFLAGAQAGFISEGSLSTGRYSLFVTALENAGGQYVIALSGSTEAPDLFPISRDLFHWASDHYRCFRLISQGATLSYLPLDNGITLDLLAEKDVYYLTGAEQAAQPEFSLNFKPLPPPTGAILEDQVMGSAEVIIGSQVESSINLLASRTINLTALKELEPREPLWSRILRWIIGLGLGSLILGLLLLLLRTVNLLRRSRRKLVKLQKKKERVLNRGQAGQGLQEAQHSTKPWSF